MFFVHETYTLYSSISFIQSLSDASVLHEESKVVSPFEKYHVRLQAKEICEVGFQETMHRKENFALKEVNTCEIKLSDKHLQCCEGEDDSEFLFALENIKNNLGHLNDKKQRDVVNRNQLRRFIQRKSSFFEQLLAKKENMLRLRKKKELDITFDSMKSDQNIVKELLSCSTLLHVECFHQV